MRQVDCSCLLWIPVPPTHGQSPCPANQFACDDNRRCVDSSARCNGRRDCADNTDEQDCPQRGDTGIMHSLIFYFFNGILQKEMLKVFLALFLYQDSLGECSFLVHFWKGATRVPSIWPIKFGRCVIFSFNSAYLSRDTTQKKKISAKKVDFEKCHIYIHQHNEYSQKVSLVYTALLFFI